MSTTMQCPTCGARQEPSDVCRRCKCDLTLVRPFGDDRRRLRAVCLRSLRDGRAAEALHAAQQCHAQFPDADTKRLLAVSLLLSGRYGAAVKLAEGGT